MSSGFDYYTTHYIDFKKLPQMNSCTTTLDEETIANLKILNQKRAWAQTKAQWWNLSWQWLNKRLSKTLHNLRDEECQLNISSSNNYNKSYIYICKPIKKTVCGLILFT